MINPTIQTIQDYPTIQKNLPEVRELTTRVRSPAKVPSFPDFGGWQILKGKQPTHVFRGRGGRL